MALIEEVESLHGARERIRDLKERGSRAGLATVAVLTGGFSEAELRDAGAAAVHHSIDELRDSIDEWLTS